MNKVRFHLPGLRYNFPLNMFWVSMLEQHPEYFREGVESAVDETITMMTEKGTVAYHGMVPNLSLGSDFVWGIGPGAVVSEKVEAIRDTWKAYVDEANK